MTRRTFIARMLATAAAGTLGATATGTARAQAPAWPVKPLRFILPFPPGGPTDLLGRSIAEKLAEGLGQPVVVDNRPGAGGNVGAEQAARAAPDGYTMVLCAPSLAISPSLYRKLAYDPQRDLAPVQLVATIPNVLVVHPSVPANTVAELVDFARGHPGKLNFGSGGAGTSNHLGGELFKLATGIDIVHVPYKGVETAMKAMLGGDVQLVVIGVPPTLVHVKAGKLRPIAALGRQRVVALPDVPTIAEAGFPGLEVDTWYGVLVPAGTPRPIVERLNRELTRALASPDLRQRLANVGIEPATGTPEQFREFIAAETAKWSKVVQGAGLKAE
jgi:tripartite-type tricarboxylate transporter receptor subunit TctC